MRPDPSPVVPGTPPAWHVHPSVRESGPLPQRTRSWIFGIAVGSGRITERPTPWEGFRMPIVAAQAEKDIEIFRAWTAGRRRQALAEQHGCSRQAIDQAIARARRLHPPVPRTEVFEQSVEILDDGLAVFVPMMLEGDKAAGRLVDRLIGRRNEMLGLDSPAKLELYQSQHPAPAQVDVKAELAALVERIRSEQHA